MASLVNIENSVALIVSSDVAIMEKAKKIRSVVRELLGDPSFLISCIEKSVSGFEQHPDLRPQQPLFVSSEQQFAAHIIYWPAHQKNSPHMHSTWGTTGVFYNEITINTFINNGSLENPELTLDSRFDAQCGDVGYLLPSCVHCLSNETNRPTATFHLFGADDANQPAKCGTFWFGDDISMPGNPRHIAMDIFCDILLSNESIQSKGLLTRIFALSSNEVKLRIIKAMSARDSKLTYSLSVALEQELEEPDRTRLAAINKKLSQNLGNID